MKIFNCFLLFFLSAQAIFGVEIRYPANTISPLLLKNADAVIREWKIDYRLINKGKAIRSEKKVITILHPNADPFANFLEYYSSLIKIKDYSLVIYNSQGVILKKVKPSEFQDESAIQEIALYSDARALYYRPVIGDYPYTVEMTSEQEVLNLLSYPDWIPLSEPRVSLEWASLEIHYPASIILHHHEIGFKIPAQQSFSDGTKGLYWKAEQLPAFQAEQLSDGIYRSVPRVMIAQNEFEILGYKGSTTTWKSLGSFFYDLNKSSNTILSVTKNEIKRICENYPLEKDKIKKLYEFMQSRTRYIYVGLGIGGYKPTDASMVDKLGYGDCKGLTNYMRVILEHAGISSFYTLINAGMEQNDIYTEFPSNQFNHAILCVPLSKDTFWLECTNQSNPFNYLGSFTSDRHALMITPSGGLLIKTPELTYVQNQIVRKTEINIDPFGNSNMKVLCKYAGLNFERLDKLASASFEEQKSILKTRIPINDLKILNCSYVKIDAENPIVEEKLNMECKDILKNTGKRFFLNLNNLNNPIQISQLPIQRQSDVRCPFGTIQYDTIIYHLPEQLVQEYLPSEITIKESFGTYRREVILKENILVYVRMLAKYKGTFLASQYEDYLKFLKKINTADQEPAIFLNKNQ